MRSPSNGPSPSWRCAAVVVGSMDVAGSAVVGAGVAADAAVAVALAMPAIVNVPRACFGSLEPVVTLATTAFAPTTRLRRNWGRLNVTSRSTTS